MITASETIKDILKTSPSVRTNAGCIFEYNMNDMLNNISVSYPEELNIKYKTHVNSDGTVIDRINKYKMLFPIDSIINPLRPSSSGIKHYIWTKTNTEVPSKGYASPKSLAYPSDKPRVYYPGSVMEYKYWVTPLNSNADVTVNYSVSTAKVIEAYKDGDVNVYKTAFPHGFDEGLSLTVSGLSSFNVSGVIADIPDQYTFRLTPSISVSGTWATSQNGLATLSSPTKPATANKIVVKFESNHDKPTAINVYVNGGSAIPLTIPSNWSGRHEIYYNGSSWSQQTSTPTSFASPISVSSVRVTAANSNSGKVIGITEISSRWVVDVTSDLVSASISKDSSDDPSRALPVGFVTANTCSLKLARFNQSEIQILEYNRHKTIDSSKIYIYKNVKITPYFSVYDNSDIETKITQGSFYMKDWMLDIQGAVMVNGLDGSKRLMETVCPEMICESYPVTAIIRRLLDSIGFTSYNFNIKENDSSIPTVKYWYALNSDTVWSVIQDLCRDIQMNAFFDENNILQFYSRNYIYEKTTPDWKFFYEAESSSYLPNIITLAKTEIASANQVQVLWNSPVTSNYLGESTIIWQAPTIFLGAGGLKSKILANSSPADTVLDIDLNTFADAYSGAQTLYNYNGFVLINSEVIEYDAIQYEYFPKGSPVGTSTIKVWISSATDLNKYLNLSEPGYSNPLKPETAYFKPTGKYRVKTRGAFNTQRAEHAATVVDFLNSGSQDDLTKWNQRSVQFK
jgi:hypothetical protein